MTSSRRAAPQALLDAAGADALRRLARRSPGWWRTETASGRTRAVAVAGLVAALAERGQRLEGIADPRTPPAPPREDVLVDQLAVVLYDLRLALAAAPGAAARGAAAAALAEVLAAVYEADPRPAPGEWVDAALAGEPGPLRDVVERLPRLRQP